jgi:hypothetical protein
MCPELAAVFLSNGVCCAVLVIGALQVVRKVCLTFMELHGVAHFDTLFGNDLKASVEHFWEFPGCVLCMVVDAEEFDGGQIISWW